MTKKGNVPADSVEVGEKRERHEVLIARGVIPPKDKEIITRLLKRLGLSIEYVPGEKYQQRELEVLRAKTANILSDLQMSDQTGKFKLADVTSRDSFVVREHLESVKPQMEAAFCRGAVGRVFNYMIDGRGSLSFFQFEWSKEGAGRSARPTKKYRAPQPIDGAVIVLRSDIGMPEYSEGSLDKYGKNYWCGHYAVQASSIIEAARCIEQDPGRDGQKVAQQGVTMLADILEQQFVD